MRAAARLARSRAGACVGSRGCCCWGGAGVWRRRARAPARGGAGGGVAGGCALFARGCPGCADADAASAALYTPPSLTNARRDLAALLPPGSPPLEFELDGSSPALGSRRRARLAVRAGAEVEVEVGLFARRSHDVVDIVGAAAGGEECLVHHPAINAAARLVRRGCGACGVRGFVERAGRRRRKDAEASLRYLQLSVVEGGVEVVLVWDGAPGDAGASALERLAAWLWERRGGGGEEGGLGLHSVWANFNDSDGNAVLLYGPGRFVRLWPAPAAGDDLLSWVTFGDARVAFAPGSFMQSNHQSFGALLKTLAGFVDEGNHVIDLYSGTGAIGLYLATHRSISGLTAIESVSAAAAPFEASVAALPGRAVAALEEVPQLEVCSLAEGIDARRLAAADVVVCDPPRRGLDTAALEALLRTHPRRRLIYVSCGWKSFQRDCAALLETGGYTLRYARAFPFFAGTNSWETLAVFDSPAAEATPPGT